MKPYSVHPKEILRSFLFNRRFILSLIRREVSSRYRGAFMGMAWSFFNPILMLSIYTFVFSGVFKGRWGFSLNEGRTEYALILFAGLIVHWLFAECLDRAPALILSNTNFVKKVVFPLEILPVVAFGAALFHAAVSVFVLLLAELILFHHISWTVLFFPLILLPLGLGTLGVSWFISSLSVFVRDTRHILSAATTVLMFMSGVS